LKLPEKSDKIKTKYAIIIQPLKYMSSEKTRGKTMPQRPKKLIDEGRNKIRLKHDSLSSLSSYSNLSKPINALSDREILALTEIQMDTVQDRYLSVLLDKQQADELTSGEQVELWALMEYYQEGLLKKASALREAVRRGLIEPLQP
jgi:hypothetical protein